MRSRQIFSDTAFMEKNKTRQSENVTVQEGATNKQEWRTQSVSEKSSLGGHLSGKIARSSRDERFSRTSCANRNVEEAT